MSLPRLDARLTKSLTAKAKKQLLHEIAGGELATLLRNYVEQQLEALDSREAGDAQYNKASWMHQQAHNNGRKRELRFLKQLLKED